MNDVFTRRVDGEARAPERRAIPVGINILFLKYR